MWIENFKSAHNVKILVSHGNANQRVSLIEDNFTTQVNKMTYLCFSFPNGLMNKAAIMVGIEVIDIFYNVSTFPG